MSAGTIWRSTGDRDRLGHVIATIGTPVRCQRDRAPSSRQEPEAKRSCSSMRVLHVQKVSGIGGSERHLLSLLPALAEAGVEVRMCVAATGRAADFTDRLRELGVSHSTVDAGPDANPLLVAALRREMRAFRPDLAHTHLIHADLHGQLAARLAGVRGISSVHGTPGFYLREPYRTARRIAGRSTTRTIAISEHVRAFVERLGFARPGTARTVHYGIDASQWPSSERGAGGGASELRDRARRDRGGGGLAADPRQGALGASRRPCSGLPRRVSHCGCSLPEMDRCAPSSSVAPASSASTGGSASSASWPISAASWRHATCSPSRLSRS